MLSNYLTVGLRLLRTQRVFAFLNIAGLALGFACFLLIALFVREELSYDTQYREADSLYRVHMTAESSQGTQKLAQTPPNWLPGIVDQLAEIETAVRFKPPRQKWMVGYETDNYAETKLAFADHQVFDMFGIELVVGQPSTAIEAPFTMVISESMVQKYFGAEEPIGKTLVLDNQYDFTVTGIMKDMLPSSHMQYNFFTSFSSLTDPTQLYLVDVTTAPFPFTYTYVKLTPGASSEEVAEAISAFAMANAPQTGIEVSAELMPVTDIHLQSNLGDEINANGSVTTVWIFSSIAMFILLIACINFMNLSTARSAKRSREVGIRKVMGAAKDQLITQFLGEAVLTSFIAFIFALGLAMLALPVFNSLTGKEYAILNLFQPGLMGIMVATALVVGLVSGSYPAFFLSSFAPAIVLKGTHEHKGKGRLSLRDALVVFQFAISIALIIATATVYMQMVYISELDLGFDKEQVVTVELTDPTPSSRFPALRDAYAQLPGVESVSGGMGAPAGFSNPAQMRSVNATDDDNIPLTLYFVRYDYTETLGMEMAAGRSFTEDFPADTLGGIVLNEQAVADLGFESAEAAVGERVRFPGFNQGGPGLQIIGVVKDFNTSSVHQDIGPVAMIYNFFAFYAFVRLNPNAASDTISQMEQIWADVVPGYVFDVRFMDERFGALYETEKVLRKLLLYFAGLTIFIACLGLFGLASYAAEKRTKEVGIRKAMGASIGGVTVMLTRDLVKLIVPAFILAAPIAWFAMNNWLAGFSYATEQSIITYGVAFVSAVLISLVTVSWQSIRAASVNPIQSLRYE